MFAFIYHGVSGYSRCFKAMPRMPLKSADLQKQFLGDGCEIQCLVEVETHHLRGQNVEKLARKPPLTATRKPDGAKKHRHFVLGRSNDAVWDARNGMRKDQAPARPVGRRRLHERRAARENGPRSGPMLNDGVDGVIEGPVRDL